MILQEIIYFKEVNKAQHASDQQAHSFSDQQYGNLFHKFNLNVERHFLQLS